MTQGQLQRLFTIRFAELLHYIYASGFEASLGEAKRSDEQACINAIGQEGRESLAKLIEDEGPADQYRGLPALLRNNGRNNGVMNSVHQLSLAVDINLFKDGKYLNKSEDHKRFGEWWEKQHELARWGGRWGDGNHYSFTWNGVS
jgi:hypothetical protein